MEVASLQPSHNMDNSMDIDMDIDLGPPPETDPIELEQAVEPTAEATQDQQSTDLLTGELQPEKVHIRGVDDLTTDDIKRFVTDHFSYDLPIRVEWIDDTSANIVFDSPDAGLSALSALAQEGAEDDSSSQPAVRLRSAKSLPSHPDAVLQVRTATMADRKRPGAYAASRFYLMHPEHDPREKLRRELSTRRRAGDLTLNAGDPEYRRRRFDDREHRRRRGRDTFHADMYDDNQDSRMDDDQPRDLFPDDYGRSAGRLRDRSASPGRDTLEEEMDAHRTRRFRERSPQPTVRNEGKELFPLNSGGGGSGDEADSNSRELFPNKTTSSSSFLKRESLFNNSGHRRSDAFDAADERTDSLWKKVSAPTTAPQNSDSNHTRNSNIELFPESNRNGHGHSHSNGNGDGVYIRGSAEEQALGHSIRGAANGISIKGRGASVRELFPSKYNSNTDKELFSDKLEGRGGPRRKAQDMFG